MKCDRKHCRAQVPDEEFVCPRCGETPAGAFVLEGPDESCACPLMHDDDWVQCHRCGYEASAKAYSQQWAKTKDLVTCPKCKGRGLVPGRKRRA